MIADTVVGVTVDGLLLEMSLFVSMFVCFSCLFLYNNDESRNIQYSFVVIVFYKVQYHFDKAAQRLINDLPTKCCLNDCPWQGRFADLEQHLTRCPAGEGVHWLCPECSWKGCLTEKVRCYMSIRICYFIPFFSFLRKVTCVSAEVQR